MGGWVGGETGGGVKQTSKFVLKDLSSHENNHSLQTGQCNLNMRPMWRTCDVLHIKQSSSILLMYWPTKPTTFIFNSTRQPVTQSLVALVRTFVTCEERGDSFCKWLADLHLAEVLFAVGGGGGGEGGINCTCCMCIICPQKGLQKAEFKPSPWL